MGYGLHGILDSAVHNHKKEESDMKLFCFSKSWEESYEHFSPYPTSSTTIVAARSEKEARKLLPPGFFFVDPNDTKTFFSTVTQAEIKRGVIIFQ